MKTVGVWVQITTQRMAERPWIATLLRWTGRAGETVLPTTQTTLQAMDAGGVEPTLLSAWYGPEGDLITNEEVAAQIDTAPARFRGLASADLNDPMQAVREIGRWVDGKRPWIDELLTPSIKFPNFHVDTSAYALNRLPAAFVQWIKGPGAKRVMFGTNWPLLSPQRCLEGLESLGLSDAQREAFLGGNARRVFAIRRLRPCLRPTAHHWKPLLMPESI